MPKINVASLISTIVVKAGKSSRFRRLMDDVLDDDAARDVILHRLGTRQIHNTERIDHLLPERIDPEDFEDHLWLLSSNYANRGLALLMLEEAAWLYDTIKALDNPEVAELGRAKGGTTFLLASAGAHVLSLENGALEAWNTRYYGPAEIPYDEALGNALTRTGISSRVEVLRADAETYPVPEANYDLVFIDIALPYQRQLELFERWWAGVKEGGRLVLRDGREPRTPSVMAVAEELERRGDIAFEKPAPGVFAVMVKGASGTVRAAETPPVG